MLGMLLSLVYPKVLLFVGNAVVSCVSYSVVFFGILLSLMNTVGLRCVGNAVASCVSCSAVVYCVGIYLSYVYAVVLLFFDNVVACAHVLLLAPVVHPQGE